MRAETRIKRFAAWSSEAAIAALYLILAQFGDLRQHVPAMLGVTAAITSLLACRMTLARAGLAIPPWRIMILAVIFRLPFIWTPPSLSDDIFRYLLDGLILLKGENPYLLSPVETAQRFQELAPLVQRVNHPHLHTIYPPGAQLLFAAGAALGCNETGIKALLTGVDALLCLLIICTIRVHGPKDPSGTVLYAWNPLPILEIASSGHVDGAAAAGLLAAALFLSSPNPTRFRNWIGGAALAISTAIKLIPAIYGPLLLRLPGKREERMVAVISFSVATALLFLPFSGHLDQWLQTLKVYLLNWEFSGLAFRLLRESLSSQQARTILLATFLLGALPLMLSGGREPASTMDRCYKLTFLFLLTTPTLHPWYAIYLCALLPMTRRPSGLIFSWSCLLSYKVQISYYFSGIWVEETATAAMVVLPPLLIYCLEPWLRQQTKGLKWPLSL